MNERILVVDDDERVRVGLSMNLEEAGYAVTTAGSGREALDIIGQADFDLVLCDLVLGDLDGLEILRRVQTRWPGLPVIMITGHGSIKNALESLHGGASDYIQKPANPEEVLHRMRTALDATQLRAALAEERRKAEQRRREQMDQTARSERMLALGMLAEGAAHDLNNILGPVLSYPALIRDALPDQSPARKYVQRIEEAAEKASAVLHDLQAIGQSGDYEKEPLNINAMIEQALEAPELRRLRLMNPRIRVEYRPSDDLPRISGSESHIGKTLLNLFINGVESMPTGGVLSIETSCRRLERPVSRYGSAEPGSFVLISVRDSGAGLSPEDMGRLFQPFYFHKKSGHQMLSGLGLTLVLRVVENHAGFIDVHTAQGQGTEFVMAFPAASQGVELEPKEKSVGGMETILIVDDYLEQRLVASELLQSLGYRVLTAESGYAAVKLFEQHPPGGAGIDLVVMDLVLGDDFDGVETFKRILTHSPGQKAVLVSGFADLARIGEARKLGVGECIQKPYTSESLGRAIRKVIDGGTGYSEKV